MNLANKEYSETEENIQIDLKDYIINDEDGYIICDRCNGIGTIEIVDKIQIDLKGYSISVPGKSSLGKICEKCNGEGKLT